MGGVSLRGNSSALRTVRHLVKYFSCNMNLAEVVAGIQIVEGKGMGINMKL